MSNDWKNHSFLAPKAVPCAVGEPDSLGDQPTENFYPISVGAAVKLRALGGSLAQALSVLFSGGKEDTAEVAKAFGDGEDGYGKETIRQAIDPRLAELRMKAKAKAAKDAVEALLHKDNVALIGEVLQDSLGEVHVTRSVGDSFSVRGSDRPDSPWLSNRE